MTAWVFTDILHAVAHAGLNERPRHAIELTLPELNAHTSSVEGHTEPWNAHPILASTGALRAWLLDPLAFITTNIETHGVIAALLTWLALGVGISWGFSTRCGRRITEAI